MRIGTIISVAILPLRAIAIGIAFITAFGYLFFLGSQGVITTFYAATAFLGLCYFAFCPRQLWVTRDGWLGAVILSVTAIVFAFAQMYEDLTFFEGPNFAAAGFRAATVVILIVLASEATWRNRANVGPHAV
jgi:hypothetical protein